MHKKQEILTAAYTLFSQKGYGLSMSDISELVGIKTPSLYSHFTGKDEIVSITVETEINKWYKALEEAFDSIKHLSCEQQLKNIYLVIIRYFLEEGRYRFWKNIFVIDNAELSQRFIKLLEAYSEVHMQNVRKVFEYGILKKELKKN
jgi:AcrR family transcriptional regulator